MQGDIVIERTYAYAVERVWRALTDPALIAQWLMQNDFEPRLGHKFQFCAQPQPGWDGLATSALLGHGLTKMMESGLPAVLAGESLPGECHTA